ncbi:MAG: hypothetical protein V4594_24100 [Bacteroidota bacterium]
MQANETLFMKSLKELNINHYTAGDRQLEYIDNFVRKFDGDERLSKYQIDIDQLRADALFNAGRNEEALVILTALHEASDHTFQSFRAQQRADVLIALGRDEEARVLIRNALAIEKQAYYQLDLVYWITRTLRDAEDQLKDYETCISEIRRQLGIPAAVDGISLSEAVRILKHERVTASRRFGELQLRGRNSAEKMQLLKAYLSSETVGYFRSMAQGLLDTLEK